MIKKKKLYAKPRKMYQSQRIKEENELVKTYGLKNKREIWKTLAKTNYFRSRAKDLAKKPLEEQEVFFNKLRAIGLKVSTIADVLSLKVEDLLNRRLTTIILKNKIVHSVKHARQMVVHKKVLVDGKVINSPSYLVPIAFENSIHLKEKKKTAHKIKEENGEVKQNNEMEAEAR